ncbi:MAG TPA: ABC transporter permease [Lactobacillus sp.]|nr:ABC transporter permease [Lactobacillus sp.]
MNKFMVVTRQVIRKNIKSPAYLFSLFFPVLIIAFIALFAFISNQTNQTPKIAITSNNATLRSALIATPSHGDYKVNRSISTKTVAEKRLSHEKIDGYLNVTTKKSHVSAIYRQRTNGNSLDTDTLKNNLNTLKLRQIAQQLGLTSQQLQQLFEPATYKTQNVAYQNGVVRRQKSNQQGANLVVAFTVTFLIYMFIAMYTSIIAQETAKAKGSPFMEILVRSVSPVTQFFGKITGMLALIVLQVVITGIAGLIGMRYFNHNISFLGNFSFSQIQPGMIIVLVVYFILGVMLYTVIAAMLGSMVTRQEEVSQALSPLTTIGMLAYIASFVAVNSNGLLIRIGSYVPFLSQSLMPVRYAVGNASLSEMWLSVAISTVALVLMTWLACRVYQHHVLDYSTRKKWYQFFRRQKS